jgi:hypothetical protein
VIDLTAADVVIKQDPDDAPAKKEKSGFEYPENWTDPVDGGTKDKCLIRLDPTSDEYVRVISLFCLAVNLSTRMIIKDGADPHAELAYIDREIREHMAAFEILEIERVQNRHLLMMYTSFCDSIELSASASGQKVTEEIVYHGTNDPNSMEICTEGLNRSFVLTHRFGLGSYAAPGAGGPIHHAVTSDTSGQKVGYIVVLKMSSTKIGKTSSSDKKPPKGCDCGGSRDGYDGHFRVIFNDSQSCPIYRIKIKWIGKKK